MAVPLADLPRFLILEPLSTVRVEMQLSAPSCEIDVELDRPAPGRSFVLLIGHKDGPFVQRVRLAGKARVFFDPQIPGEYVLLLANPQKEPITLRLRARDIGPRTTPRRSGAPFPRTGADPRVRGGLASHRPTRRSKDAPR